MKLQYQNRKAKSPIILKVGDTIKYRKSIYHVQGLSPKVVYIKKDDDPEDYIVYLNQIELKPSDEEEIIQVIDKEI